jgi:hypothetical protein
LCSGGILALIEVDRECQPVAARRFVSGWRFLVPGMRAAAASYFRTFVARQSPSLQHIAKPANDSGFFEIATSRHKTLPFVMVQARRPN